MSDSAPISSTDGGPEPAPAPAFAPPAEGGPTAAAADRPEIAVGAAFAGGFALAMILRRLAR